MKKFLLAFLLFALPAQAAHYIYDPVHTQIMFSVNHLGLSNSHGKFSKFSGGFTFDKAAPEKSKVDVSIDTASINMDSKTWEDHLKSRDFFNVAQFPAMTFKSTKIVKTGDNTGTLTGDLTLLGVTKPVALDVTFNKEMPHPMNKNMLAGFSAVGKLKRSDFGMNYGLPMVSDEVKLIIEVEGIRQDFDDLNKK